MGLPQVHFAFALMSLSISESFYKHKIVGFVLLLVYEQPTQPIPNVLIGSKILWILYSKNPTVPVDLLQENFKR